MSICLHTSAILTHIDNFRRYPTMAKPICKGIPELALAACLTLTLIACNERAPKGTSELDSEQLIAGLHEQMSHNSTISNRESWKVIATGSKSADDTVRLFYKRILIESANRATGLNQNQPDYWNREHVWPQSYGLRGTVAARDLHNIVPVDRTVNTSRSNKVFGTATQPHYECSGCRTTSIVWEPPDSVKGDVARILFYMDIRYDGNDDEPELRLSDTPEKDQAIFGGLSVLYRWHCSDRVSAEEESRNEVIAHAQGNRNLFVDYPELAERLYGFECVRP